MVGICSIHRNIEKYFKTNNLTFAFNFLVHAKEIQIFLCTFIVLELLNKNQIIISYQLQVRKIFIILIIIINIIIIINK